MNIILTVCLLVIIFGVLPVIFLFTIKNNKLLKIIFAVMLGLYVVVLCIGVFADIEIKSVISINSYHIPKDAEKIFHFNLLARKKRDLIINLLMFIPFGFIFSNLFNKFRVIKTLAIGAVFSIFIEFVQHFLPTVRTAQLSDIVLNIISCLIGALLFVGVNYLRKKVIK
ncbi:MAG: VanZ family protein [Clostridia bacterium]|nr:VanZ family protein [Clostridia bacterium]